MRLCCICGPCGRKMVLQNKANTRAELARQIGYKFDITCGHCKNTSQGDVSIVFAEGSYKNAPVPTILGGGGIGVFFGPGGLAIGLIAGIASGMKIRNSDKALVNLFNNS